MWGKGFVASLCIAAALAAQETRADAPPRGPVEETLPCGLRVRLVPARGGGKAAVILGVHGAGILAEPRGRPHLAHVSEHAIVFSDGSGPLADVPRWFAEGRANAETLPEIMVFDLLAAKDEVAHAIAMQHRRFTAGVATPEVLAREKPKAVAEATSILARRTRKRDLLGKFAWTAFTQAVVFAEPAVAFHEATEAITAADVDAFRGRTFRPGRAMLTVVGDFDLDAARRALPRDWTTPAAAAESRNAASPGTREAVWDIESHHLFLAWTSPPPRHPAHGTLALAAQALAPRLMMNAALLSVAAQPIAVHADVDGLFVVHVPLQDASGAGSARDAVLATVRKLASAPGLARTLGAFRGNVRQSAGLVEIPGDVEEPRRLLALANVELARMRATLAWGEAPEAYCARLAAHGDDDATAAALDTHLSNERAASIVIAGRK